MLFRNYLFQSRLKKMISILCCLLLFFEPPRIGIRIKYLMPVCSISLIRKVYKRGIDNTLVVWQMIAECCLCKRYGEAAQNISCLPDPMLRCLLAAYYPVEHPTPVAAV